MTDTTTLLGWREALDRGRFDDAYRIYLVSGAEESDSEARERLQVLSVLADVQRFVRERSWERARRQLQRLDEPLPVVDWAALGEELERLQRSSESLEQREAEEALGLLGERGLRWFEAEACNQRGTARVYLGDVEGAEREFERAVELDPRHFRALTNLGNARLESGLVAEAIGCYERALQVNDEFANAHHNLGVAYRKQGKIGLSVKHLRRAQRVQQRVERERARERIGASGDAGLKALRWSLIGLAALALFVILQRQGLI
ncbi:MAG TPA: tetratricopeptide repeat protein [Trueperaceae bacterium]